MQTELTKTIFIVIAAFMVGAGTIICAIFGKRGIWKECWKYLLAIGIVIFIAAICVTPIGTESYFSEVTILKTEQSNGVWNVYFDDGGSIRSVRCTESNPWHSWKEGETVKIKYGRIKSLSILISNEHYQLIKVCNQIR